MPRRALMADVFTLYLSDKVGRIGIRFHEEELGKLSAQEKTGGDDRPFVGRVRLVR